MVVVPFQSFADSSLGGIVERHVQYLVKFYLSS